MLIPGASAIHGRVEGKSVCARGENQVWISRGKELLYQATVPAGSTFEFYVRPGPHDIVLTTESGCMAEVHVETRQGEVSEVVLAPRELADHRKSQGRSPANSGMCVHCGMMNGGMAVSPFASPFPAGPLWVPYGMMSYPNFYSPGPWMNGGFNAAAYPGFPGGWHHGGAVAGKPNVYIHGPPGTSFKFRVVPQGKTHLLASVPAHGKRGWTAKQNSSGDGGIHSESAELAYLFYDYRFEPGRLQGEEGFCTDRTSLMPRLEQTMSEAGFTPNEIEDFHEYWSIKMPAAKSFCVFPQDERVLESIAHLEVRPVPLYSKRVVFIIVPNDSTAPLLKQPPLRAWVPKKQVERIPASNGLGIHEWGVGFLTTP